MPNLSNFVNSTGPFQATLQGNVASGELVVLMDNGKVRRANTITGIAGENANTPFQAASQTYIRNDIGMIGSRAANTVTDSFKQGACLLPDNSYVFKAGNTTSGFVHFSETGNIISTPNAVPNTSYASHYWGKIAAVNTTAWAFSGIIYDGGSTTYYYDTYIINDSNTVINVGSAMITSVGNTNYNWDLVSNTTSGTLCYAYAGATGLANAYVTFYNSSGTLLANVNHGSGNGGHIAVLPSTNGDYVVVANSYPAGNGFSIARYSATGTQTQAPVNLSNVTMNSLSWPPFNFRGKRVVEWANSLVIASNNISGSVIQLLVVNAATGVVTATVNTKISSIAASSFDMDVGPSYLVCTGTAGYVNSTGGAATTNSTILTYLFDSSMNLSNVAYHTIDTANVTGTGNINFIQAFSTPTGAVVSRYDVGNNGVGSLVITNLEYDSTLNLVGTQYPFGTANNWSTYFGAGGGSGLGILSKDGVTLNQLTFTTSSVGAPYNMQGTVLSNYKTHMSSILGVSNTTASNGTTIQVSVMGAYKLPNTQIFRGTAYFDNRTQNVPGAKGQVFGNNVVLYGIN